MPIEYVDVPPPICPEHFRDLLLSELGADVRFRVGGETFPAHRCVLAARSPVLKAQLFGRGAMGEASPDAHVVDGVRADVFRQLLHFIYTDSLPSWTEEQGKEEEAAMARHLLEAADRYGLERLTLVCEKTLCGHIDATTVVATLTWADRHRCHGLRMACFGFMKSQVRTGAVRTGLEDFIRGYPSLMIELLHRIANLPVPGEVDDQEMDDN